jgi:hypothetical protein
MKNKKILLLAFVGLLLITIPLTLFLTQKKQETRTRANASTTLSFTPDSTATPIQKKIGDPISIDIMVTPGTNLVTFVRFQVKFDTTKLTLADTNPFVPNTAAFPTTIEGPIASTNMLAASISVGSDPTKAIQTTTKLGTLNLKAIGATGSTPTQVIFTALSEALSAGANEQAAENILSTTIPANITINDNGSPTITEGPISTPSATVTPAPTLASTTLKFNLLLHGIGSSGDNPNPGGSSLSNKNPLHPQRDFIVTLINTDNQPVASIPGSIIYNPSQGNFISIVDLGPTFQTGNYNIKVKSDRYLRKIVPGIINIEKLKENAVPQTALVAGDVKADNVLNILDYNILLNCGYGAINPLPVADPNAIYNSSFCKSHEPFRTNADLDDNGIVNGADYNLFLRELSVQNGD